MSGSSVLLVDGEDERAVERAAHRAAQILDAGGLVVMPTDTVYGLACRPDLAAATRSVFEAKGRPTGLSLPVLTTSDVQAWEVARPDERALLLAARFWPGPLTMALPRAPRSSGWALGDATDTVAVRVPGHRLARRVLDRAGPLAVTSANRSGQPPLSSGGELQEAFGAAVALYLFEDEPRTRGDEAGASTVVDLTGPRTRVTREGTIRSRAVEEALANAVDTRPERPR